MKRLEVNGAVRPLYGSLGFKGLKNLWMCYLCMVKILRSFNSKSVGRPYFKN